LILLRFSRRKGLFGGAIYIWSSSLATHRWNAGSEGNKPGGDRPTARGIFPTFRQFMADARTRHGSSGMSLIAHTGVLGGTTGPDWDHS